MYKASFLQLGYVALAADVYGKGVRGNSVEENFGLLKPLLAERYFRTF